MFYQQTGCSIYRHDVFKDWSAYTRPLHTCNVHGYIFIYALKWCATFYTHLMTEWCLCSAVRVCVTHTTRRIKNNVCVVLWGDVVTLYTYGNWVMSEVHGYGVDWLCVTAMHCIAYFQWHELFHGIPCQKYHKGQVLCRARTNIRYTVFTGLVVSKGEYSNLPLHHYNELIKLCSVNQSEESSQGKLISTWALSPAIHNHPIRNVDISKFWCN